MRYLATVKRAGSLSLTVGRGIGRMARRVGVLTMVMARGAVMAPGIIGMQVAYGLVALATVGAIIAVASIPIGFMAAIWYTTVRTAWSRGPNVVTSNLLAALASITDAAGGLLIVALLAVVVSVVLLGWAVKAWRHHPDTP